MYKLNLGNDLYVKGRIGWKGLNKNEYLSRGDYRIINATSLQDKLINWDICGFITKERYDESPEIQLEENDILISKDGTLGKIGYVKKVDKPSTVASGVFVLRNTCKNVVYTDYLYHILKSSIFKDFINKRKASGSTINHLYQRDLVQFEIDLPLLEKQKKVANLLSSLDSKIELNNKINKELKSVAKTLYDYWFVQFDFPNKNGKPYKSSGGKMIYNKRLNKKIPNDWIVVDLSDISNITMGQSPSGESYNERGDGIIFYQGCTDFGDRFPNIRKFTTKPSRHAKKNDILLSVRAPVGTINIANEDCCIGRGLAALNSKIHANTFLFGVMVNLKQVFDRRNTSGTTFGSITKNDLFTLPVVIPNNNELILEYDKKISSSFKRQNIIGYENKKIEKLRDLLLPMLMNGQVSVK